MREKIRPARGVSGTVRLPGDKSISHRYAMLAAIAEGRSVLRNYASGADCASTLACVRALGVDVERSGGDVTIDGRGLAGLAGPAGDLDAGNSGSTIRFLSGILAAQSFSSRIRGDESLSRRPMDRILRPLREMNARVDARDGRFPPLEIHGARLHPIDYTLPVASAQVKTCVLFAGLHADGVTTVHEPVRTRDHTEIALAQFGASIECARGIIRVHGRARLSGCDLAVPGDLSSAAFFLAAGAMLPESRLVIEGVGLNPTRAPLIDLLIGMGVAIEAVNVRQVHGELTGDLVVTSSRVRGGVIEGDMTAAVIDEIPVLAVMGALSEEGLIVRDAADLRVKETDRIATVADNLRRMQVDIEERPDGLAVPGRQRLRPALVDSFGDHRIAMAFAVAALASGGECAIERAEAASVSFPEFYATLRAVAV
ncbi:MAG: 3-phosphoshikimate 1-carboxyvinyltransferase [Bryobacteraceae bacterium]